jgi:guanine deaminase
MAILPGLIDVHGHLPQFPLTGLNGGLTLIPWLSKLMAPTERKFSGKEAGGMAERYFELLAGAGTTTALLYGSVDAEATDAAFAAAEKHGIRLALGHCLMNRMRYDDAPEDGITRRRLDESEALCRDWHGRDNGRLRYAFTPRFALSCSREMMSESARLAKKYDAYWQTHLSEDPEEMAMIHEQFPEALNYLDVYDRAGGLGPRAVFAHSVHLSDSEIARLVETGSHVAHCPSNVFGGGGILDTGRYRSLGVSLGLASDVGGCTDISLFKAMEIGWITQRARLRLLPGSDVIDEFAAWLELATLGSARVMGLEDQIGSLQVGKEADIIAVNPSELLLPSSSEFEDSARELLLLLIFRNRPAMVKSAWVRGKQLPVAY